MKSNNKVSIIIPVYNVEKYLRRCIESVINQTYTDLEIWLVDDGSTDGSGDICDEYAGKDNRISVIHQENKGQSDARNIALDKMTGTYLTFVDSDDFIHESMVKKLVSAMNKWDADMVGCKMERGHEDRFLETKNDKLPPVYIAKFPSLFNSLFDKQFRTVMSAACAKLYKKDIFANIRFPSGKIHEDEFTIHHILAKCNRIVLIGDKLYYHYERQGSTTQSVYSLKSFDAVEAIEDRCAFFHDLGNENILFKCYQDYLRRVQWHYYSIKKYLPENEHMTDHIRTRYKEYYNAIKVKMGIKNRIRYGLFLWMPNVNRTIKNFAGAKKI